jgi:hypothetical protein
MLTAPVEEVGPWRRCRRGGASLPPPADRRSRRTASGRRVDARSRRRSAAARGDVVRQPAGARHRAGSQPLVLWKDRQFAEHRTTYAGNALSSDLSAYAQTDPALLRPVRRRRAGAIRGLVHAFLRAVSRSVLRLGTRPDVSHQPREIASDAEGHRLLSAGFHSQMGYFRDDRPLYDLVLDEAQQRQLDDLWKELDFVTLAPVRQFKQFIWFERAEPPSFMASAQFNRSARKTTTSRPKRRSRSWPTSIWPRRERSPMTRAGVVRDYFER